MSVLIVASSSPFERKALRDLFFHDDMYVVTPGQNIAGKRFDAITHTSWARHELMSADRDREWYAHLRTRLNPDGFIHPLPEPEG